MYIDKCPYCGSGKLTKKGFDPYNKQKYKCGSCGKYPTEGAKKHRDKGDIKAIPLKAVKDKEIYVNIEKISKKVIDNLDKRKRYIPVIKKSHLKKEVWLQMISDFHYGLRVRPVEIGGMFEYNAKVAKRELDYLLLKTCRILEYYPNRPDTLVITLLGDMIDNAIMRDNQMAMIELQITDQIMGVVELFTDYIITLSKYFKEIKCFGVYGNHGRITQSVKGAHPKDNFDRIVYWSIKERLKGLDNISLEFTEAQHMLIDVEGWRFWLEHGDTVRSWAGIPFYGAKREKNNIGDMLSKFSEKADYMLAGHFHNDAEFENIYMNGAFVGGDIFSIGKLRRMGIPSQTILGINKKHGVVWKRKIQLIDEPKKMKIKVYK
ncbi:MAG: hypothetical protein KAT41_07630 [Candidatus Marinimicrobia bacterium]|nr:hypothetical protein [Candidatus Neomarinimicrobiota bacterium]